MTPQYHPPLPRERTAPRDRSCTEKRRTLSCGGSGGEEEAAVLPTAPPTKLVWNERQEAAETKQRKSGRVSCRSPPECGHHSRVLRGNGGTPRMDHAGPVRPRTQRKGGRCVFRDTSSKAREAAAPQVHSCWDLRGSRWPWFWALKRVHMSPQHRGYAKKTVRPKTERKASGT